MKYVIEAVITEHDIKRTLYETLGVSLYESIKIGRDDYDPDPRQRQDTAYIALYPKDDKPTGLRVGQKIRVTVEEDLSRWN